MAEASDTPSARTDQREKSRKETASFAAFRSRFENARALAAVVSGLARCAADLTLLYRDHRASDQQALENLSSLADQVYEKADEACSDLWALGAMLDGIEAQ